MDEWDCPSISRDPDFSSFPLLPFGFVHPSARSPKHLARQRARPQGSLAYFSKRSVMFTSLPFSTSTVIRSSPSQVAGVGSSPPIRVRVFPEMV